MSKIQVFDPAMCCLLEFAVPELIRRLAEDRC